MELYITPYKKFFSCIQLEKKTISVFLFCLRNHNDWVPIRTLQYIPKFKYPKDIYNFFSEFDVKHFEFYKNWVYETQRKIIISF